MDQKIVDKLMELKQLHETGVLTKEEMESEKKKKLQSDSDGNNSQKSVTPKKKTTKKPWLILVIVVLVAIGGWYGYTWYLENVYYYAPPSSFKESVEGIYLNDRYDETLEKLKADPENKKRGMATDPDKTTIGIFQKTYHGVVFDYVDFSFSVDAVSAIELRKTANVYDNNPQEIINSAYNRISKELKDKLSVVESESSDEIVFRDGCSVIKVCKSQDSMTEEYELTVKIEHD